MKITTLPIIVATAAAALAGCARPAVEREVDLGYIARGSNPSWFLQIGESAIWLTFGVRRRHDPPLPKMTYPPAAMVVEGGVRRWQSGSGVAVISVEAWPGGCQNEAAGSPITDRVRVRLSGRELEGCGGFITGVSVE